MLARRSTKSDNNGERLRHVNDQVQISWGQFVSDVETLAIKIQESNRQFESMIAVTRGGLFVAGLLSYRLNIQAVDTIGVYSYTAPSLKNKPIVFKYPSQFPSGQVLVVDDLEDSGDTLQCIAPLFAKATYAAVYKKGDKPSLLSFYGRELPGKEWVVFPWDSAT